MTFLDYPIFLYFQQIASDEGFIESK